VANDESRAQQQLRAAYEVLDSGRGALAVYAFSSFDLVNSTAYKARAPRQWPDVIKSFYYNVERAVDRSLSDDDPLEPRVWKYIGDEVVLFTQVYSVAELGRALQRTADACSSLQRDVAVRDTTDPPARRAHRLGVKASCWVALVGGAATEQARNVEVQTRTIPIRDFLGPDIDVGFRIGKCAMRGAVTLSAALAQLLLDDDPSRNRQMRLVGYNSLRGVWHGRPYPAIWYRADWQNHREDFDYDELQDLPRGALSAELRPEELRTVLGQTGNLSVSDAIQHYFAEALRPQPLHRSPSHQVEVHVAAACIDRRTGAVLMRQRQHGRGTAKSRCWDFGSALLAPDQGASEILIAAYRAKYGVELERGIDVPLSYFCYAREGRVVSGFVFAAEVLSGPSAMHDHNQCPLQWYSLEQGPPADAVDDAERVFDGLRRWLSIR
jgi:hypothetical protein